MKRTKTCRGKISVLLGLAATLTLMCSAYEVKANNFFQPDNLEWGVEQSCEVSDSNQEYFYALELDTSGKIHIESSTDADSMYYYLYYASDRTEVFEEQSESNQLSKDVYLQAGSYVFAVKKDSGTDSETNFQCTFTIDYERSGETVSESISENNDTKNNATPLECNTVEYVGQLSQNESEDYYSFNLPQAGKYTLNLDAELEWVSISIIDYDGETIWSVNPYWNESKKHMTVSYSLDLMKGSYCMLIRKESSYVGKYKFNTSFAGVAESLVEVNSNKNDLTDSATSVSFDKKYNEFLALNDKYDIYKISFSDTILFKTTITGDISKIGIMIEDLNGNTVFSDFPKADGSAKKINYTSEGKLLASGTYYVVIEKIEGQTGKYSFTFSKAVAVKKVGVKKKIIQGTVGKTITIGTTISPSNASNRKVKLSSDNKSVAKVLSNGKVKLLSPGKAVIYVRSAENTKIYAKCTVVVTAKAPKLKAVKENMWLGTHTIICNSTTNKKVQGYQVSYSTKKNFKNARSKIVLMNKYPIDIKVSGTIYVRVRSFVKCNGKKYYSKWSNVKKVTLEY